MDLDNLCIGTWVDVECRFFNTCTFMIAKLKVSSIKTFIFKKLELLSYGRCCDWWPCLANSRPFDIMYKSLDEEDTCVFINRITLAYMIILLLK